MTDNALHGDLDTGLFALPPDHVVVALRSRTGHEHLGWRKPGQAERLRCAALLASDRFHRREPGAVADTEFAALTDDERSVLCPPATSAGVQRLRSLLDQLDRDPAWMSGTDVMADVQAAEQLLAWITAAQATRLTRLAEPGCAGDPSALAHAAARTDPDLTEAQPDSPHWNLAGTQLAVGYLGAALCISPISAGFRISDAQDLLNNLPALHDALRSGTIDPIRARILQQRTRVLERQDDRRHVVTSLLRVAMRHNPGRFSSLVDAAVIEIDPDAAEARRQEALDRRGLRVDPSDDGMARFIATLPATEAQLAWDLFDSIAQALKGFDDRCAAHRRADAFTTMIELLAAGCTVSAESLLHEVLTSDCSCSPSDNAELATNEPTATDPSAAHRTAPPTGAAATGDTADSTPVDLGEHTFDRDDADERNAAAIDLGTDDAQDAVPADGSAEHDSFDPAGPADFGSDVSRPTGSTTKQWSLPTRQGRRTHATVVLPWEAFVGLPGSVAELVDYGMITEAWARTLLQAAATVTLLVTDPATGRSVAVGDRTYRPKQDVRDQVVTAYPTCIFTGCSRPSRCCDLDHLVPFRHDDPDQGGATRLGNLFPVCRRHHRLKTLGGWTYEPGPDGVRVTSPLGTTTTTVGPAPTSSWPGPPMDALPPF